MKRDEKVNQLLHDSEHAQSGARFAAMMKDFEISKELKAKSDRLLAKAQELDPGHEAPAWNEHREWILGG